MVCLSPRHGGGPRSEFITLRFEHTAPHDRIHRYGGRCARECTDAGGLLTIISLLALAVSLRLPPHFRNRAGGYSQPGGDGKKGNEPTLAKSALGFSFGVSSSLSILGVFSTVVGSTYGQTGPVLPCLASSVAIAMGLNLLEVVQLEFPSAFQNFDPKSLSVDLPPVLRSFLAGQLSPLFPHPAARRSLQPSWLMCPLWRTQGAEVASSGLCSWLCDSLLVAAMQLRT